MSISTLDELTALHRKLLNVCAQIGLICESNNRYTTGLVARLHKILAGRPLESLTLAELIQIEQRYHLQFNERNPT